MTFGHVDAQITICLLSQPSLSGALTLFNGTAIPFMYLSEGKIKYSLALSLSLSLSLSLALDSVHYLICQFCIRALNLVHSFLFPSPLWPGWALLAYNTIIGFSLIFPCIVWPSFSLAYSRTVCSQPGVTLLSAQDLVISEHTFDCHEYGGQWY